MWFFIFVSTVLHFSSGTSVSYCMTIQGQNAPHCANYKPPPPLPMNLDCKGTNLKRLPYCRIEPICKCRKKKQPVRCKGEVFDNQCQAMCKKYKKWQCIPIQQQPCGCPKFSKPVWCDGKKYENQCLADCAGQRGCVRRKPPGCMCPYIVRPVICDNGIQYLNKCDAFCRGAEGCFEIPQPPSPGRNTHDV